MSGIDRRTFVKAGLATVATGSVLGACSGRDDVRPALQPDDDGLAAVGRAYLADHADEADLEHLVGVVPSRSIPRVPGNLSRLGSLCRIAVLCMDSLAC